ncbi:hypothetical protein SK128_001997 [Halocaridina rubra]|uniref:Uncharacterized protein n=1 Tax=Halocaridina rubra TaxID=373956 RepID=A0AAN8WXS6_HALRR
MRYINISMALPSRLEEHEEYQWADVHVNLSPDHATTDIHGHSKTRSTANQSMLTVTMDTTHYRLSLTPTSWLVAPGASLRRVSSGGHAQMTYDPLLPRPCLYLAHSLDAEGPAGTLSLCHRDGPRVLLMTGEELAEFIPHPSPLRFPQPPPPPFPPHGGSYIPEEASVNMPHIYKRGHPHQIFTHIVKRYPVRGVEDQECTGKFICINL